MDRLRPLTDEELAYKEARSKGLTGVDQVILPSEVEERARCDEKVVLRSSYYDDRPGGVKMVKHPVYMPRYLHSHRFVELTWIASGSVEEELEGKDITAVEGDVVMIMPGYYHSIWTDSEDTLALNFLADPAFFASLDERFSLDLSACSHAVFGPVDLEAPVECFLAEREKGDEASPFAMEVAGGVATGWQLVMRSRNIYGPYEARNVMDQGSSDINGPHQGAWTDTPSGEDWFILLPDCQTVEDGAGGQAAAHRPPLGQGGRRQGRLLVPRALQPYLQGLVRHRP